jgi:hypothetical protein
MYLHWSCRERANHGELNTQRILRQVAGRRWEALGGVASLARGAGARARWASNRLPLGLGGHNSTLAPPFLPSLCLFAAITFASAPAEPCYLRSDTPKQNQEIVTAVHVHRTIQDCNPSAPAPRPVDLFGSSPATICLDSEPDRSLR